MKQIISYRCKHASNLTYDNLVHCRHQIPKVLKWAFPDIMFFEVETDIVNNVCYGFPIYKVEFEKDLRKLTRIAYCIYRKGRVIGTTWK